jgi:hypothetical protein
MIRDAVIKYASEPFFDAYSHAGLRTVLSDFRDSGEAALLRWPKPDSLALHPTLVELCPASHSIHQVGLENQRLSRSGPPHAQDRW